MLVFGDHVRARDPRDVITELEARLADTQTMPPGLARHAHIVRCFIDAGMLAQGLADHGLAARGHDARAPADDAVMTLVVALARAIAQSWGSAPFSTLTMPSLPRASWPESIELRRPEGYAFYALYPEAYLCAARAAGAGERTVIGIRSIGTGLSAMVAVATGSGIPSTVRPVGDPFDRRLSIAPELLREWTAHARTIAIVDEGPGLSGSSFGAVTDALVSAGVPSDRIECFPSHAGELGPVASSERRERWRRTRRHVVSTDTLLDGVLDRWVADVVGPLTGPLVDLSGGGWRSRRFTREEDWPASVTYQERRKLLARTDRGTFLVRFVGLGEAGEQALDRARLLHRAGFTSELIGVCHGFSIERWHDDARSLGASIHRAALVAHLGRYLGFRARELRADESGASMARLVEMTRRNAVLALGDEVQSALDRWEAASPPERSLRRVAVDARLHRWEWLVDGERLLKSDAIDHCAAHDLVGMQDVAWDVAGAAIELSLDAAEERSLVAQVGAHAGHAIDPRLVDQLRPSYLAFQLGRHSLATSSVDPAESTRLRALAARYAHDLRAALHARR
jgi:hypothetical protein